MALFDLRVCWNCRNLWIEDDHMYEDTNRCPTCGAHADQRPRMDGFTANEMYSGSIIDGGGGAAPDYGQPSMEATGTDIAWDGSGDTIAWDDSGDIVKWD